LIDNRMIHPGRSTKLRLTHGVSQLLETQGLATLYWNQRWDHRSHPFLHIDNAFLSPEELGDIA
jgi:hypothetical protein